MTTLPICSVDGCNNPIKSRGLCLAHYFRFRRYGSPLVGRPLRTPRTSSEDLVCIIPGCGRRTHARRLCSLHYEHDRDRDSDRAKCSIIGCDGTTHGRGLCSLHYARWLRHRNTDATYRSRRICQIDGCSEFVYGHDLCSKHYQRWVRNGDPLFGRTYNGGPLKWITEQLGNTHGDECIEWPFARGKTGYGIVRHNGKNFIASRYVCEMVHGPAPQSGLDCCHSCDNPPCVNPRHLRWDTRKGNMADVSRRIRMLKG